LILLMYTVGIPLVVILIPFAGVFVFFCDECRCFRKVDLDSSCLFSLIKNVFLFAIVLAIALVITILVFCLTIGFFYLFGLYALIRMAIWWGCINRRVTPKNE
jgi:hypothetical protein